MRNFSGVLKPGDSYHQHELQSLTSDQTSAREKPDRSGGEPSMEAIYLLVFSRLKVC